MSVVNDPTFWTGVGATVTAVGVGAAILRDRRSDRQQRALLEEEQRKALVEIHAQNAEQLRRQTLFEQDWNGEPDRPGVAGRDGVMKRLQTQDEKLAEIAANTKSLPDRMRDLEDQTRTDRTLLHELNNRMEDHIRMQHGPAIVVPVVGQTPAKSS